MLKTLAAAVALICCSTLAMAATNVNDTEIFLCSPDIPGTVTDPQFEGCVQLLSFSVNAENSTNIGSSSGGGGAGKVKFDRLTLVKPTGADSAAFLANLFSGQTINVGIYLRKAAQKANLMEVALTTALVAEHEIDINTDGSLQEQITIDYGMIELTFNSIDKKGKIVGTRTVCWDRVNNQSC